MAKHTEPGSARQLMPSMVNANRVIEELYGDNPNQRIPKERIVEAAAKAEIAPDVMYYFRHLPEKEYTKRELIDTMNSMVKERGRVEEIGLFGVVPAAEQAARGARR